jgi:hypothetical protein
LINDVQAIALPTAGVLHSSARLLEMLALRTLSAEQLVHDFNTILVCPPHIVLNLSQRCGWIEARSDGLLLPTSRGQHLLASHSYERRLREQMRDYVMAEKPAWGPLLPRGRKELKQFAPKDIVQVFREAGLMEMPPSDEVVKWWDEMAQFARGTAAAVYTEVGRVGERLTLQWELKRTGKEPVWQSVESNLSGFDVLSVVAAQQDTPLRIEVKSSLESLDYAAMYVSRNEWMTANTGPEYKFHLWCVHDSKVPKLAELSVETIAKHIPQDNGAGEWEKTVIPFRTFADSFTEVY